MTKNIRFLEWPSPLNCLWDNIWDDAHSLFSLAVFARHTNQLNPGKREEVKLCLPGTLQLHNEFHPFIPNNMQWCSKNVYLNDENVPQRSVEVNFDFLPLVMAFR